MSIYILIQNTLCTSRQIYRDKDEKEWFSTVIVCSNLYKHKRLRHPHVSFSVPIFPKRKRQKVDNSFYGNVMMRFSLPSRHLCHKQYLQIMITILLSTWFLDTREKFEVYCILWYRDLVGWKDEDRSMAASWIDMRLQSNHRDSLQMV